MKQKYVKMNNNRREFSLGNLTRIIKEISLNKVYATQTEIFYSLFGAEEVSDSTVNNYCIGYRAIGTDYKQEYIKRKKYPNKGFDETAISLLSILKGRIINRQTHEEIEKALDDDIIKRLCLEMYNIAKNDKTVSIDYTYNLYSLIKKNKLYDCLCEILLYIVLEKKQPIYIDKTQRELFEDILNNTNISINDLQQLLEVQLKDGINYTYSLKKMAKEKNPYASFELGDMEYKGMMTGSPRYIKAYNYFLTAAEKKHPRASWLIGKMFLEGKIGNKSKEDLKEGFKYLKEAEKLGSIAAINSIGICYLNGLSKPKDKLKAIEYFERAAKENYVYAHNNLGRIYEEEGNLKKAYEHYLFSSNLEESWASNKMGQWYLKGIYVQKDKKKAFECFNKAIEVPKNLLNHWAYYNLAKYFYLEGSFEVGIEKDIKKAIEYFEKSIENGIDKAYKNLIYIYTDKYLREEKDEYIDLINKYIKTFSLKEIYKEYEKEIQAKISTLKTKNIILVKKQVA